MQTYSVNKEKVTARILDSYRSTYPDRKDDFKEITNYVRSYAIEIDNYIDLVKEIAQLSYCNPNILLFFRGQTDNYPGSSGKFSLYPSIYRSDRLTEKEKEKRFEKLDEASHILCKVLEEDAFRTMPGIKDVKRIKKIQWSLLQHYEGCETPLLDITQSIRVACSFALNNNEGTHGYVFAIALPFTTGRISSNSEEDITNIRLLSICPPDALRPYFQEGYLAGTEFVLDQYENKGELDFANRLVAAYKIPKIGFWESPETANTVDAVSNSLLFPDNDKLKEIMDLVRSKVNSAGL